MRRPWVTMPTWFHSPAGLDIFLMLLASYSNFGELVRHDNTPTMHEAAIEHLTKADRVLARLIRKVGPCEFKPRTRCSPFQALVQSVAHQQLNGTAANTILKRVMALYPHRRFPRPEDLLRTPDEHLRGAGLSRECSSGVLSKSSGRGK